MDSIAFTSIVVATIAINAIVLGLQTYNGVESRSNGYSAEVMLRDTARL